MGDGLPQAALGPETTPESWPWDDLDAALRPALVVAARHRFSFFEADALDIYQTSIEEILRARTPARDPRAMICKVFYRRALDLKLQRERRARLALQLRFPSVIAFPIPHECQDVGTAIASMDAGCRELMRRHLEGYSEAETARATNVPQRMIYRRMSRCLETMRRRLRPYAT